MVGKLLCWMYFVLGSALIVFCFDHLKAEYQREKIPWTNIQFNNNQPCLSLLAKRPTGIFHLLDDESNFPQVDFVDLDFVCKYGNL